MALDYTCGIDTGGTFTDCVVLDGAGRLTTAKASSTPHNFSEGGLAALSQAAGKLGLTTEQLLASTRRLAHGTTVGTNTIVQRTGARVGLITTRGHADVIHIMRGARGIPGLETSMILHFPEGDKPRPIIPKPLIEEVSERVDCRGQVVVGLNESEARAAIARLVAKDVESIAICFLWSFKYPEHERRVRDLVRELAPDVYVSCSVDLVPRWGEYERTVAVALNSYMGPSTSRYIGSLEQRLRDLGYGRPLLVMQRGGGVVPADEAGRKALLTLDSGPVGGILGSQYLAQLLGQPNVIATDMGGTSFDVGLIYEGQPVASYQSIVNQYEFFVPRIDIRSIGSGGGSLIWLDEVSASLHVGPRSAGALPGPACYGRGGTQPTVTDADLVLGYLDPDYFLDGQLQLDPDAAWRTLQPLADRLGLGVVETAAGAAKVVEYQMADLIRKATVQKGYDPRDFVVYAYGGAGPVHAGVYARELGAQGIVVPLGDACSLWSALGAASADLLHVYEAVDILPSPFDPAQVQSQYEQLEARGRQQLVADGLAPADTLLQRSADLRYRGQINEVEVPVPADALTPEALARLIEQFHQRYELLYGKGAAFRAAQVEIVTYRVRAGAASGKPALPRQAASAELPAEARGRAREVYWSETQSFERTPVYYGQHLRPGNALDGPAIIEVPDTTIVVHPGQRARLDGYGNVLLEF